MTNIAVFSFKDNDSYEALTELVDSYEGESIVFLMPVIKPLPKFFESVIKVSKEKAVPLKCYFNNAEGYDQYLKYAEDLILTDNPTKEVIRQLSPADAVAIVWDDTPQSHFVAHSVEDLALEMWDITDDLTPLDEEDYGFEMDSDKLHEELLGTMGKFVDLLAAFVANTVMDSLSEAVAQHIMMSEDETDKKDFNPFDDKE